MATFGVRRPATRAAAWAALIWTELVLAAGVAAGIDAAAYAAALMMIAFAAAMVGAIAARPRRRAVRVLRRPLARRLAGRRCATSRSPPRFAALPLLSDARPLDRRVARRSASRSRSLACLGLAVAVLALAREVGMLRLRLGPESALEIPEEGPALGSRVALIERFSPARPGRARARRLRLRGLPRLLGARAGDRVAGARADARASRSSTRLPSAEAWRELERPGQPLRGRDVARRHRARQGDLQQPRPARERAGDRRAPRARRRRGRRSVAERADRGRPRAAGSRGSRSDTSRRGFLARVGRGPVRGDRRAASSSKAVKPGEADAYHFCGHTYTTGSCPHPSGLPRIDARGYPLGPGREPIDNLGRPINDQGEPVNEDGQRQARSRRAAAAAGAADAGLRRGRQALRLQHLGRRRLVSVLRRARSASSMDCCSYSHTADQRRRRARRATATAAARSSASCTSRRRCRVEPGSSSRSPLAALRDRAHRHLVAVRLLDDRDDRPDRPRGRPADDARGLRDLPSRRARRRQC